MTTPQHTPPPAAYQLYERLKRATEDSPYIVTPTDVGFDLKIDIVDAKWWGILNRAGLKWSYVHHVNVIDSTTYKVIDETVKVTWSAGVPSAQYSYEKTYGRSYNIAFGAAYAFNDNLKLAEVYNFKFNSEEGRQMLKAAAKSLGMKEKLPWPVLVGAIVALGTLALLVLSGIGVGLYFLFS